MRKSEVRSTFNIRKLKDLGIRSSKMLDKLGRKIIRRAKVNCRSFVGPSNDDNSILKNFYYEVRPNAVYPSLIVGNRSSHAAAVHEGTKDVEPIVPRSGDFLQWELDTPKKVALARAAGVQGAKKGMFIRKHSISGQLPNPFLEDAIVHVFMEEAPDLLIEEIEELL